MDQIKLVLPDGSSREYRRGITAAEVAADLGREPARSALAATIDGKVVGLSHPLTEGGSFRLLSFENQEGRDVYRHSTSHILAQAVKRLYPNVRLGIGPAIADGFYYDFDAPQPFTPEDLEAIEAEMARIVAEDLPIQRRELDRDEALEMFEGMGEKFKVELINDLPPEATISCYRQGEFIDLCAGPHLPSTGRVKAFKLLSVAGAYWRGDEKNPMLQRIYGTAFERKGDLEEHLARLEEAKRRDHRILGRELDLYSIHEESGTGLIYWHPKGALVRELIEDFWREEHRKRGYDIVYTPHIANLELWKVSGHWENYRENMYSPMDIEGSPYLLKPMNCPFHILMYKSQTRSYRDLPLRWGELGTVYRYERSGVLHGLLRVRGFTQDDAHIFCRPDQFADEIRGVIRLAQFMMKSFGYSEYDVKLSTRDPENRSKYIGSDEIWGMAESALARVLDEEGIPYEVDPGEAKFYGPAIDIKVKDALGRGWQGPTIQLDFNLPERFDITFVGEDGKEHRPVMIHRTVLGSMERFFGGLIEHYAGAFPVWLAPVQVVIIPITQRQHDYAWSIRETLAGRKLRVEVDDRNEKMGYKIRQAQLQKVPYMLVVGEKEAGTGTVAVRRRDKGDLGAMALDDFLARIGADIEAKV